MLEIEVVTKFESDNLRPLSCLLLSLAPSYLRFRERIRIIGSGLAHYRIIVRLDKQLLMPIGLTHNATTCSFGGCLRKRRNFCFRIGKRSLPCLPSWQHLFLEFLINGGGE